VTRRFDAVVWGGTVGHSKPHPEPFLLAARRIGVPPARCLVFEDSSHGLWAGRRAGMTLAAIAERARDLTWVRKWTPYCFQDFRPVKSLLEA
jgi:beta-phosphoglucomutase-like phosphatase (HAD superfamily)